MYSMNVVCACKNVYYPGMCMYVVKLHVLNILEILPVACSSLHDMYRWYIVHVFVKNVRVTSFNTCIKL